MIISSFKRSKIAQEIRKIVTLRYLDFDKLLLGSDNGLNPIGFAKAAWCPLWTSSKIYQSPHFLLLKQFEEIGEKVFHEDIFRDTPYCVHALKNIALSGRYYQANDFSGALQQAQEFIAFAKNSTKRTYQNCFSATPIEHSDCYLIHGDMHRICREYYRGAKKIQAQCARTKSSTYLQQLISSVLYFNGDRKLYQPINFPELKKEWVLIRKCSDRFDMMQKFLRDVFFQNSEQKLMTYLDIGSFYGWFVKQMSVAGYKAFGIEIDPIAAEVGAVCYGNNPDSIMVGDAVSLLARGPNYDVISFLSVLHHYVTGREPVSADEMIKLIDSKTNRVLFLDMGQEGEGMFNGGMKGWTPDFIEKWILRRTTFRKVFRLGIDGDARYPHADSYGRTLFAFTRD